MASSNTFMTERMSPEINVLGYGADPTGIADSRAAFEAAIADCEGRDYPTLYVPAGTYKITSLGTGGGGLVFEEMQGLCVRGDGSLRSTSHENEFVGTTIRFDLSAGDIGIKIKACMGLRFENLNLEGAANNSAPRAVGVLIESIDGNTGSTGMQFQNCVFRWCNPCVQTANTNNNSELAFYDCVFEHSNVGFKCLKDQALVHKFIGCTGGGGGSSTVGMTTMFDLDFGGNITVIGFGGQNISNFLRVGQGGGNIGWNEIINLRLEQMTDWGNTNRTKLYSAVKSGSSGGAQRTVFDGVVLTPPGGGQTPADNGITRFTLLQGHEVVLRNASPSATMQIATPTSKLVDFDTFDAETPGGTFRCYNTDVAEDARLDRENVPSGVRYLFENCQSNMVPYADKMDPPLYGPNYLMSLESHCWSIGDGLQGVTAVVSGTGCTVVNAPTSDASHAGVIACNSVDVGTAALHSGSQAAILGGGVWRCRLAARLLSLSGASDRYIARLGYADETSTGEPDNGVYFRYSDNLNSGNWEAVLRVGGSTVATDDTGVPGDTSWHSFEIITDTGGASVFYIDGVKTQAELAAVPTAGVGLLPAMIDRTSAGDDVTQRLELDYYRYDYRPNSRLSTFPE